MKLLKSLAALTIAFLQYSAVAQECDDLQLSAAQRKFETGNFEQVFELLTPCLKSSANAQQKVVALRLLALSNFALDSVEDAYANVSALLDINPDYQAGLFDPPRFAEAIQKLQRKNTSIFVTSVSKKAEDIKLTPGTVVVITEEQIRDRGYADIEALFSDLPGFDISRLYGLFYSNVYQRGYRATNADRTLLLVDGVEDNDLWNNVFYLGAQYPLSNIQQVEVIYGPASTIYGPNAFVGVINIITKDPAGGDKPINVHAETGYGTYNTSYFDVYASGKTENVAMSFTARRYSSELRDLSGFEEHNYSPDDYNQTNYNNLLDISNADLGTYITHPNFNNFYNIVVDGNGDSSAVANNQAIAFARNGDQAALGRNINGQPVTYNNLTDNVYFNGKIRFSNFTLGGQYWKVYNGATNYRTDRYVGTVGNGLQLVPVQYFLYGDYSKELIKDKLFVQNKLQYRVTAYDDETGITSISNYDNGGLGVQALLDSTQPSWLSIQLYQYSQQTRNELKFNYIPNDRLDIVIGAEYRNSLVQGNYIAGIYPESVTNRADTLDAVSEVGAVLGGSPPGGNTFKISEIGVYAQATYKASSWLNIIAGSRYDYNRIRATGGYGSIVNPRLGLIAYPRNFVVKAIYATAFQNASNWTKFSTAPGVRDLTNPTLPPEEVDNIDLSLGYRFSPTLFGEVVYYRSNYSGSVFSVNVPYQGGTTSQNQAIGQLQIQGVQANLNWTKNNYRFYFNYTYCDPRNTKIVEGELSDEEERVGDIASHRANAGVNARYFNRLNINLRANYVGVRPSGEGTSVSANPHGDFEAFFLLNASIRIENLLKGFHLQLGCNNMLDLEYSDPGMRTADGVGYTAEIPQKRINFMLKAIYTL